jgi:hypothetical protein
MEVNAGNVKLQCSNIRVTAVNTNGIRVAGAGTVVFLENVWIENWNQNGGGFPAIEALSSGIVYLGRGRFFQGVGPTTGGSGGVFVLDN